MQAEDIKATQNPDTEAEQTEAAKAAEGAAEAEAQNAQTEEAKAEEPRPILKISAGATPPSANSFQPLLRQKLSASF